MDVTYRVTRQGKLVAYGPASEIRKGYRVAVTKQGTPVKDSRMVDEIGSPFMVDGVEMAYGYLAPFPGGDEKLIASLRRSAPEGNAASRRNRNRDLEASVDQWIFEESGGRYGRTS